MKGYFCYRHTFFKTTTLSRLFLSILNLIYACVHLMDVFNGCSLIQMNE